MNLATKFSLPKILERKRLLFWSCLAEKPWFIQYYFALQLCQQLRKTADKSDKSASHVCIPCQVSTEATAGVVTTSLTRMNGKKHEKHAQQRTIKTSSYQLMHGTFQQCSNNPKKLQQSNYAICFFFSRSICSAWRFLPSVWSMFFLSISFSTFFSTFFSILCSLRWPIQPA